MFNARLWAICGQPLRQNVHGRAWTSAHQSGFLLPVFVHAEVHGARVRPLASDERADMLSLAERMQRVVGSWSLTDSPESCAGYRGGLNGVWHPIASLDSAMACGAVPTEWADR